MNSCPEDPPNTPATQEEQRLTAVQRLSDLALRNGVDEELMSEHLYSQYLALMGSGDRRDAIARQLDLTTPQDVSDVEMHVFNWLRRKLPVNATLTQEFIKILEARRQEHYDALGQHSFSSAIVSPSVSRLISDALAPEEETIPEDRPPDKPSSVDRATLTNDQLTQLGMHTPSSSAGRQGSAYVRSSIQQACKLLKARKVKGLLPTDIIGVANHRILALILDPNKTDRQICSAMHISTEQYNGIKKRIRNRLLKRGATVLGFPLPPEDTSAPNPTPEDEWKPGKAFALIRMLGATSASRDLDIEGALDPATRVVYQQLSDPETPDDAVKASLPSSMYATRLTRRIARAIREAIDDEAVFAQLREEADRYKPAGQQTKREVIQHMHQLLTSHKIDPLPLFDNVRLRQAYHLIAIRNAPNKEFLQELHIEEFRTANLYRDMIRRIIAKAPHIVLGYSEYKTPPRPVEPKPPRPPKPRPTRSTAPDDSVGGQLMAVLIGQYPLDRTGAVEAIAERGGISADAIWRFLASRTHPVAHKVLTPILDYLDLNPGERAEIEAAYDAERKAKIQEAYGGKVRGGRPRKQEVSGD